VIDRSISSAERGNRVPESCTVIVRSFDRNGLLSEKTEWVIKEQR